MKRFYKGYIEGYFGRELGWEERYDILEHLASLEMNTYLLAPKEDPYHRLKWKLPYPAEEMAKIKGLVEAGKERGIEVMPAMGPGLSYDYESEEDYKILVDKFKAFFEIGADTVVLFMDDVPLELPEKNRAAFNSLGDAHGQLLVKIYRDLKELNENVKLLFCPTVYTDEFVEGEAADSTYMKDLAALIPAGVPLIWTGNMVMAETITIENIGRILEMFNNDVVIFDNYYANDYMTERVIIGPYQDREEALLEKSSGIMINPTGLVQTDKFLLSVYGDYIKNGKASEENWKKIAREFGIPEFFDKIAPYFWHPFTGCSAEFFKEMAPIRKEVYEFIVHWVNPLKLEWYPYMTCLLRDLHYYANDKQVNKSWVNMRFSPYLAAMLNEKLDK